MSTTEAGEQVAQFVLQTLQDSKALIVNESPQVIRELILQARVASAAELAFGLALTLFFAPWVRKFWMSCKELGAAYISESVFFTSAFVAIPGLLVGLTLVGLNISKAISVWIAPRAYLFELMTGK